jgi:trehalose/maltose transport system permease protein
MATAAPSLSTVADEAHRDAIRSYTPRRKWTLGRIVGRFLFWALIVFLFVYTLFPYVWAFLTSIRPNTENGQIPVSYWPKTFTWEQYRYTFSSESGFLLALRNSAIVSVSVVLISIAFGASAAYALGRLKFRGRSFVLYMILSMTTFPAIAILGTLFQVIRQVHIYDTYWALIFSYLIFTLPFTVWTLTNFFKAMPGELEESALVDGATPFRAFWQILLPLALPGLVTTGLLAFINAWNEYLFALTFTNSENARTAPVVIANFAGNTQFDVPWGAVMAASVTVTLPLILLVLVFQRLIIGGLTAGAVKG